MIAINENLKDENEGAPLDLHGKVGVAVKDIFQRWSRKNSPFFGAAKALAEVDAFHEYCLQQIPASALLHEEWTACRDRVSDACETICDLFAGLSNGTQSPDMEKAMDCDIAIETEESQSASVYRKMYRIVILIDPKAPEGKEIEERKYPELTIEEVNGRLAIPAFDFLVCLRNSIDSSKEVIERLQAIGKMMGGLPPEDRPEIHIIGGYDG